MTSDPIEKPDVFDILVPHREVSNVFIEEKTECHHSMTPFEASTMRGGGDASF